MPDYRGGKSKVKLQAAFMMVLKKKAQEPQQEALQVHACRVCHETVLLDHPSSYLVSIPEVLGIVSGHAGGQESSPSNSRNFSSLPVCRDQA